jgi:hypothetical protein
VEQTDMVEIQQGTFAQAMEIFENHWTRCDNKTITVE